MVVGTVVISPFIPWWGIGIVAFVIGALVGLNGAQSFVYGFLGVGIVWLMTMLLKNSANEGVLLEKMTGLFPIESPIVMILAIALIGGLVGGLSAASGGLLRKLFDSTT